MAVLGASCLPREKRLSEFAVRWKMRSKSARRCRSGIASSIDDYVTEYVLASWVVPAETHNSQQPVCACPGVDVLFVSTSFVRTTRQHRLFSVIGNNNNNNTTQGEDPDSFVAVQTAPRRVVPIVVKPSAAPTCSRRASQRYRSVLPSSERTCCQERPQERSNERAGKPVSVELHCPPRLF